MQPHTLRNLELGVVTAGQTILLAVGWGFVAVVFYRDQVVIPDHLARIINANQTTTTWIVCVIATLLTVASNVFLTIPIKAALQYRMHTPISLIDLSGGIAMARGSFILSFRHLKPTLVTLVVFGLTKLLYSSWSSLLQPTLIKWPVQASGWELDITSNWFETVLQQELVRSGVAVVRGNSSEIVNVGTLMSGIASALYTSGERGAFNFNGARYNVSTGGVLPAVPFYAGSTANISGGNTGLAFAGGQVPTHLDFNFPKNVVYQGLAETYIMQQQGLTANVTCSPVTGTMGNIHLNSTFQALPVLLANGTIDYWLWAWNITGNCSQGNSSQQQYVTRSNSSTVPQSTGSGFISSLVCPYPLRQTGFSWERFILTTNASWKYDFLPMTVCSINPLVTTSNVIYSAGVINATAITSQSLGMTSTNLSQFLAAIVDAQSRDVQGLTTNTIGDALYAIYTSVQNNTSSDINDVLLKELARYWQGVIEFSGTFLRSAFSVPPYTIPSEAQSRVNGTEMIMTQGWSHYSSTTYGYMIIPITVVAFITYAAAGYTLWNIFKERDHYSLATFDPSNPVHTMMVSSARDPDTMDHLGEQLAGFEPGGIGLNETVRVELIDIERPYRKRFRVTDEKV